jgi:hypothetical protein
MYSPKATLRFALPLPIMALVVTDTSKMLGKFFKCFEHGETTDH